jgi:cold shock CspA family protein
MQGVISSFDPQTHEGVVIRDTDQERFTLALDALDGSLFRMLRQGQRVIFQLDRENRATRIRIGAERDMGLPGAEV